VRQYLNSYSRFSSPVKKLKKITKYETSESPVSTEEVLLTVSELVMNVWFESFLCSVQRY
jgi:hypothetical protein